MNSNEDQYRPPASNEPPANHSMFSRDEWMYMAKVFACWIVGASVVVGVWLTGQTVYALKAFSAAGRTGGIVVVSALRQMAPIVVIFAACGALVMVIERRTERQLPPPSQGLPLLVFAAFYVALPVVNIVILGVAFALSTVYYDGSAADFWKSVQNTAAMNDFPFGIMLLSILTILFHVSAPRIMPRLSQFAGLLVLKVFLAAVACVIVAVNLGNTMAPLWFALVDVLA